MTRQDSNADSRMISLVEHGHRWWTITLLAVALTGACDLRTDVPNARLVCESDEDCPAGYLCQAGSSLKRCCLPGTCPGEADSAPPPAVEPPASDAAVPVFGETTDAADAATPDASVQADVAPDAPAPPDGELPTLEDACADYGRAICAAEQRCVPIQAATDFATPQVCEARLAAFCRYDYAAAAGSHVDTALVAGCARRLANANTTCIAFLAYFYGAVNTLLPECLPAPGDRPNGAACSSPFQCQSLRCTNNDATCGVCAPKVDLGGSCMFDDDCRENAGIRPYCGGQESICAQPGGLNDGCDASHPCDYFFRCGASGRCESLRPAGAACTADGFECDDYSGFDCALSASGSKTGTCQAVRLVAPGGACTGPLDRCRGGVCKAGRCAVHAMDGKPCSGLVGECLIPALCRDGRCQLPTVLDCPAVAPLEPNGRLVGAVRYQ